MSIEIRSDKEIYLTGLPVATGGGGDTPSGGGGISVTTALISPSATISLSNPIVTTEEQS